MTFQLNPFGKKEKLEISEKTGLAISQLVNEFPDLWDAVKAVAYAQMNACAREMITKTDRNRDLLAERIKSIDDLLKSFSKISSARYDETVERSQHLPVLKTKTIVKKEKKSNIFDYIRSNDIRDRSGKIRLTASN
jgi:hypothetical protein